MQGLGHLERIVPADSCHRAIWELSLKGNIRRKQDLVALGQAVRQIREERSVSLDDLGASAGIDSRSIATLEIGRLDPHYDVLLALAEGLGVRPSTFVIRAEEIRGQDEPRRLRGG